MEEFLICQENDRDSQHLRSLNLSTPAWIPRITGRTLMMRVPPAKTPPGISREERMMWRDLHEEGQNQTQRVRPLFSRFRNRCRTAELLSSRSASEAIQWAERDSIALISRAVSIADAFRRELRLPICLNAQFTAFLTKLRSSAASRRIA